VEPSNREILFTPTSGRGIDHGKRRQTFPIEGGENVINHWRNLLECVQSRRREDLWSPMDLGFRTQTVLQMAMLSDRGNRILQFDPENRAIKG
jgi:hypothetical protein